MQHSLVAFTIAAVLAFVYAQQPHDPCRTCQQILNIAEHHFHNNITDQNALLAQLQQECQRVGQIEGDQARQDCLNTVNDNIDTIYSDLASGTGITQTCYDIQQCTSLTTVSEPPHSHPTGQPHTDTPPPVRGDRRH